MKSFKTQQLVAARIAEQTAVSQILLNDQRFLASVVTIARPGTPRRPAPANTARWLANHHAIGACVGPIMVNKPVGTHRPATFDIMLRLG
jgi:hypothetical protein